MVARIDDREIHRGELDEWLKNDWFTGLAGDPGELYQLRRAGLEGVIDDALIQRAATREGLSSDAYLERETAALGPVTDAEVDAFYERHKDRIQPTEPLERLRPKIRSFLDGDRAVRVMSVLRGHAKIEIMMKPPPPAPIVRHEIPQGGASRGPRDAPVTIVEFSDYQCPFCRRAEDTIHQLEALYPGKLRIVYRHLPLEFHDNAMPAARAAVCAEEQSRFWDYHDRLFANPQALSEDRLLAYASDLELDGEAFRSCLDADTTRERVEADIQIARNAGASATPTFFINGILLRGAQPLQAFRSVIDRELAQPEAAP
ncbi:MAG: thioredoxin domain-containing protein [bacterium]|nr:thioredoxin domain-containing protein [bacterium]